MEFGPWTYLLGYVAGVLSTLSPCVLPLVPILIASVVAEHRRGPLALAAGLTSSFVVFGLFFATIGISIGMDQVLPRKIAAAMLIVFSASSAARPACRCPTSPSAGTRSGRWVILSRR